VAKIAPVPSSTTGFKFPEPKLPKLDLDALFAVQKANLAAAHEAQAVLVEAFQAIAKAQQGRVEQAVAEAKAALESKKLSDPQAVLAEVKAAVEKNAAVAKEVVDLAVAAQRRVVELFTQRAQASVEELKAAA
jgi:flagellar biosynthesis/type III secretory pathway protein FliH